MNLGQYIEIGRMDALGRLDTPIHRLDPRAKILVTAAFIVTVMSFGRYEISALAPLLLFPVIILALARLPVRTVLAKLLIAAPFALMVGAFNPFLDREVVTAPWGYPISGGWLSFASILIRFALTVGAALILVASTGIHRLCAGLERLGMPRVFAVQVLFLYRYLFVVVEEGLRMVRSVELRAPGAGALRLRVYASLTGHLLLRSIDRAQRIYQAMVARGFEGEIRVLRPGIWGRAEWGFLAAWLAFFAAARAWNLPEALGRLLTGH